MAATALNKLTAKALDNLIKESGIDGVVEFLQNDENSAQLTPSDRHSALFHLQSHLSELRLAAIKKEPHNLKAIKEKYNELEDSLFSLLFNDEVNINFQWGHRSATLLHRSSTLLHHATFCGNHSMARLLLQHGADPNIGYSLENFDGITPLKDAIFFNNIQMVELLLEYEKTDVNLLNKEGESPLDIAYRTLKHYRNPQMIALLEQHGATRGCSSSDSSPSSSSSLSSKSDQSSEELEDFSSSSDSDQIAEEREDLSSSGSPRTSSRSILLSSSGLSLLAPPKQDSSNGQQPSSGSKPKFGGNGG